MGLGLGCFFFFTLKLDLENADYKIAGENNGMTSDKTRPLFLSLKTLLFVNKPESIADKTCTI